MCFFNAWIVVCNSRGVCCCFLLVFATLQNPKTFRSRSVICRTLILIFIIDTHPSKKKNFVHTSIIGGSLLNFFWETGNVNFVHVLVRPVPEGLFFLLGGGINRQVQRPFVTSGTGPGRKKTMEQCSIFTLKLAIL